MENSSKRPKGQGALAALVDGFIPFGIILNSSVVEQTAVNRLVVGSNPTWGDKKRLESTRCSRGPKKPEKVSVLPLKREGTMDFKSMAPSNNNKPSFERRISKIFVRKRKES